jgi:AraC-like DNA-binding protein
VGVVAVDHVIAANYLSNLEKCLEQFGVSAFLFKIGFDPVRVHDPNAYLSIVEFKQVVAEAYKLSNCPQLGLVFGQSLSIVNHGFLGYAAMSSPTLGTAIQTALSYLNTRTSLLTMELFHDLNHQKMNVKIISLTEDPVLSRFMTELAMIHFVKMRTFLINNPTPCPKLELQYAMPDYVDYYHQLFQTEILFGAECSRIWLEAEEFKIPINFADDVSYQLAKTQLQELVKKLSLKEDYASKIKAILLNHHLNHISMEEVASTLCMTSRTLRRHLQRLQVTYQELFDEVREQKATAFLLDNSISITEISFLLGFNDTSSFTKAFKRWTGLTPSEYKEQHGII